MYLFILLCIDFSFVKSADQSQIFLLHQPSSVNHKEISLLQTNLRTRVKFLRNVINYNDYNIHGNFDR